MQKKTDAKIEKLLTEDQLISLEEVQHGQKSKGSKGGGNKGGGGSKGGGDKDDNGNKGDGAPPKGHPFGGGGNNNSDESNAVFMTVRYGPKYTGLAGKELKPLSRQCPRN